MSCPMRGFKYIVPLKWVYYNKTPIYTIFYLLRGGLARNLRRLLGKVLGMGISWLKLSMSEGSLLQREGF